ncbi:uncharacterized protein LOC125739857 [Brienomyrus brachyistius]|uniref:uncharacterized protein LOC125739857 n=1 Tax=Brienomyrus brachyistius TaxID=42636 RepID=UPI0020B3708B|nr:uncharacterized protein LOC125739857 [Brienomyrus brachyistius]
MAEASSALDPNQFSCPICLDQLKDPVTTACGHSYCMNCIKSYWDQEDHLGVYRCPQCRHTFIPRPVLYRNTILAEVIEKLKKTGLQTATPADHYAGPGDVECDVCTGRKHKAVKSCLVCLASYCESHLQPHYESPAFKKHKLTDATGHLQDKVCSQHDKPLEVYCCTDQQCICYLCTMDEHRGHDTVSAVAGRTEIQKQMRETQEEFQQRIQTREKELQELREAVGSFRSSAQSAVEDSERIFTEMIRSIERRRSEVTKLIRDQEKGAVSQAERDMERLKQDIDELKRRHSELEQLSHTEDHIHFLQRCQSLPVVPEAGFGPRISVYPRRSFENVRKMVSELKDLLEISWEKKMAEIHPTVTKDAISPVLVPRTRAEFLQYSCQLTLDPNTANRRLSLSEGNRKVTRGAEQPYPDHPERFDWWPQVLCRESLTGRCYWEAEWSGEEAWIGVTYKGIGRKGDSVNCELGANDKSWSLCCDLDCYSVCHNNKHTVIPIEPSGSRRVGVYLDQAAGTLSFYRVSSDGLTLLYSFTSSFTEPLYLGFWVYTNSSVLASIQNHIYCKSYLLQKQEVPLTLTHRRLREKTKLKPIRVSGKMAEASIAVDPNQFCCPICLDQLKDPVTIACGHSYCMNCIKICWDQEDHAGVYRCPQCRQTFTPRPLLYRNTILAEVMEKLKTGLQAATPADHYAGPGDVECDSCTGRKRKAAKSCLVCLVSYCETHLQPHYESPAFKKHKLTEATGHLQDKVCSHHDKPLEVYCHTDQQCICLLCVMDEHRGHDTVSAATGRTEIQKQMGETQKEFQQGIQMREKELQELREAVGLFRSSAQSAVEDSKRIFTKMIHSIERRRSEVTKLIRDQEKTAVSQAERDMERLKQEIDELKRRHSELEQLSHTEDHIHFLQRCQDLTVVPEAGFGPRISVYPHCSFENVRKVVSELKDQLENVCEKKTAEIHYTVTKDTVLSALGPRTRAEFLQYSCQLTLDPNTANSLLSLSEGDRKVTWGAEQPYPDHPERFDYWTQVLCRESLTGRCYWEAEWSGDAAWIGVTYKGIRRKGESTDCVLGFNDKSWMLRCSPDSYSVHHNNNQTDIRIEPSGSRRVGVYLDWGAGTLSFYRVSSDGLTLLYSFTSSFAEPLYLGFWVYKNSSVSLCMLG